MRTVAVWKQQLFRSGGFIPQLRVRDSLQEQCEATNSVCGLDMVLVKK